MGTTVTSTTTTTITTSTTTTTTTTTTKVAEKATLFVRRPVCSWKDSERHLPDHPRWQNDQCVLRHGHTWGRLDGAAETRRFRQTSKLLSQGMEGLQRRLWR